MSQPHRVRSSPSRPRSSMLRSRPSWLPNARLDHGEQTANASRAQREPMGQAGPMGPGVLNALLAHTSLLWAAASAEFAERATTPRTPSAVSRARWENTALRARSLAKCALLVRRLRAAAPRTWTTAAARQGRSTLPLKRRSAASLAMTTICFAHAPASLSRPCPCPHPDGVSR